MTVAIDLADVIRSEAPIEHLLKRLGDVERVREEISRISHPAARSYLETKLLEYTTSNDGETELVLTNILGGILNEELLKQLTNLGLITIAYKALLKTEKPEDIILKYGRLFERHSEELELLVENHIVRKELFENPKDLDIPRRIRERLAELREGVDAGLKRGLDAVIQDLEDYSEYARRHSMHQGMQLGHHQLFPAFKLRKKDSLLLQYATGAGKTWAAMQTMQTLLEDKPRAKILIVAPNQSIAEGTWSEESLRSFGMSQKVTIVHNGCELEDSDIVIVNYDKLPHSRSYLARIREFAERCDLVILDEAHNIKNPDRKISTSVQELIRINKPKRLILSATPVYNDERDVGMLLYLSDPVRWRRYGNDEKGVRFSYRNKAEMASLIELMEKSWWEFERNAVKKFHGLPTFSQDIEFVNIKKEDQDKYFDVYTDIVLSEEPGNMLEKAIELEKAAIYSLVRSEDFLKRIKEYVNAGYVVNIFSRLKEGVFDELETVLGRVASKNRIGRIDGSVPLAERIRIQRLLKQGSIDVLINQWECSGEAFSETTGDRPVVIIPLMCPYAPGMLEQIIGRSYRPGQKGDVELVFMLPDFDELKRKIKDYIDRIVEEQGVKRRESWEPTHILEDAINICLTKTRNVEHIKKVHGDLTFQSEDISSIDDWIKITRENLSGIGVFRQRKVVIKNPGADSEFARLILGALKYIGAPYDPANFDDNLVKAYSDPRVLLTKAGLLNLALASIVSRFKDGKKAWTIADYGSCTMVFTQSRFVVNTLEGILDGNGVVDKVISVEGNEQALNYGKECLEKRLWLDAVKELPTMDPALRAQMIGRMSDSAYYQQFLTNSRRINGNFVQPLIKPCSLDCAIVSQSLHYNNQKDNRDIEKIVLNINSALKTGGYLIACLTARQGRGQSVTTEEDFSGLSKLLATYGFEIIESDKLKGTFSLNGDSVPLVNVTSAPYYIVARKIKDCKRLVRAADFAIYAGTKHMISGGVARL